MMSGLFGPRTGAWQRYDLCLIGLLLAILCVMILPLPTVVLDALLATNLTLAVCVLMVAVYLRKPLEFSTFPTIILLFTAFRIALSVASTRLILLDADAGDIIETFGNFVVQGNVVVGMVIFLIITTVQFLVVTKGAERIAEVSARFTLDAMPGKQMSIEADIRSGDLSREAGREKRDILGKESQFFGAMDGAMKFVKGDAIAGLIIIIINLIGGISIGVAQNGMSFSEAIQLYSLLTVGDGLVAQIPALFVALCAGMVVTRVSSEKSNDLGTDIIGQLTANRKGSWAAAGIVMIIGFLPGFPIFIFAALALGLLLIAMIPAHRERQRDANPPEQMPNVVSEDCHKQASDRMVLQVSAEDFEAYDWTAFVAARAATLNKFAARSGYMIPWVGVEADANVAPGQVQITLDSVPIVFGKARPETVICYGDNAVLRMAAGTQEPEEADDVYGPGYWMPSSRTSALVDAEVTHFSVEETLFRLTHQTIRANLSELLPQRAVLDYVDTLSAAEKQGWDEVAETLSDETLHDVVHRLMSEAVPLLPSYVMIETLLDWSKRETDPILLTEYVRQGLRRQIAHAIASGQNQIATYLVDPEMDKAVREAVQATAVGGYLALNAAESSSIVEVFSRIQANAIGRPDRPAIIAANDVRRFLQKFLMRNNIVLPVIAQQELCTEFDYRPLGVAKLRSRAS